MVKFQKAFYFVIIITKLKPASNTCYAMCGDVYVYGVCLVRASKGGWGGLVGCVGVLIYAGCNLGTTFVGGMCGRARVWGCFSHEMHRS